MSAVVYAYRLTPDARSRALGRGADAIPREVHVHADGHAVACCDGHGDRHFASLFGLLDHYGLAQRDLESADPGGSRASYA